jgi:LuxR family maltose regulon positive regulatory protein
MFANLLRQRRRANERDIERQLHLTASTWYRDHGFPLEAVRQAVAGGDIDSAVRLLGESWLDLILGGESAELRSLLAFFDESQKEAHADLAVVCGFLRLQDRDLSGASACVERAVSQSAALPTDRRGAVEMMSAAIRLRIATLTGQEAEDAYKSVLLLLQQSDENRALLSAASKRRRTLVLYDLSAYEVSRWLYEEPKEHLQDVMAAAGTLGMTHLALRARAQVAFLDFFSGRLHRAQETAREVIDAAERRGWRSHHSLATAQHALGGVDIFRGDLDAGLHRLVEARVIVDPVDQVNRFRIGFTTLIGLRAKGAVREAREGLEQLQAQYRRWRTPPKWAEILLLITEAEQLALEGHNERALELLDSVPEATVHPVVGRHSQVFHAQLLLHSGKPAEARAALEHIIHPPGGWLIDVRALVVDALAAEALGRHDESLQALDLAVEKAAVEGIREPFLVSGQLARPLLQELLERGTPHEAEVLDILGRLTPQSPEKGSGSPYIVEPLTARELEVLRALQGTASNAQIANRLFISLNTLRTHIKHIHSKLGVTSRSDAVDRGRDLGIL